jgi:hypothetical protein
MGAFVRIFSTTLLTATFLGSAIVPGWSPQPASLTAPLGTSCPAAAGNCGPPPTRHRTIGELHPNERRALLPHQMSSGKVKNAAQAKNFIQTGDPNKSAPPPPPKAPLVKPASMSQAQWQRVLATRPKPAGEIGRNSAMDRLQGM